MMIFVVVAVVAAVILAVQYYNYSIKHLKKQ